MTTRPLSPLLAPFLAMCSTVRSALWMHWPWLTGGLLVTFSAGLHLGFTEPWQAQAEAQLAVLQQASTTPSPRTPPPAEQAQQRALSHELPAETSSPQRAAALMDLARRQGLVVLLAQEQTDSSGQLQLQMQGKARYPALRTLVGGALTADAALVLERMSLRRAEPTTPELDFDLLWTFSHRKPVQVSELAAAQRGPR
jgi:hypothetical protein